MGRMPGLFNVAVEAIIIKGDKFLITKRSSGRDHAAGEWETLTGRVDQGENLEQALEREVKEEVGLSVKIIKPFHTFHFYRGIKKVEHLGVSFLCKYISGKVVLDKKEQVDYKWVTIKEAKKIITDESVLSSIKKLEEYLRK